jgi:fluoroacetyl-CoA thioesterase
MITLLERNMNLNIKLEPGMFIEEYFVVGEEHLAQHIGSGSVRVLATPWMIALMERVSHKLLAQNLPEGFSSVGVSVEVQHIAPSPLGSTIKVRTEVIEILGSLVSFEINAWDEHEPIGKGRHKRAIIDLERFLAKVAIKTRRASDQHGTR